MKLIDGEKLFEYLGDVPWTEFKKHKVLRAVYNAPTIEALQKQEHDGCEGCKYTHKDQYEMPCLMCKQSKLDLWEGSDTE